MVKKEILFGCVFMIFVYVLMAAASAEKLGIEIENNYVQTGDINFTITLYDDQTNKIDGLVTYRIFDFYSDLIKEGSVNSGEKVNFKLPEDAVQGTWEIQSKYNGIEASEKFNVGELRKIEINLDGDNLIVKNIGNVDYGGYILIYIGDQDQTADIFLARGQTKRIRLTAPDGEYAVRVISEENTLEFNNVGLTGNVVGLESVLGGQSFWTKYPIVALFLGALVLVAVIVVGLRFRERNTTKE